MNNCRLILFVTIFFNLTSLHGQDKYSLNRCITTGLERNFSILIARNFEEISANNFTPGNAGYLPTLGISSRYGGTVNNTTRKFSDVDKNDTLISGIHNKAASASATLNWMLFQGFSAHTSYKKLNELKQVGELNTQMAVEDFVADMVSEYYLLIQQLRQFSNLAYATALSRERVRIDKERYLLGSSSKLQLLQSQVYLNSDSSRYAKHQEVLRASQVRLNELMAADNLGELIVLADTVISIHAGLDYDSLLSLTLRDNTGLRIARKDQTISEYDYKLVSARTYPYLSLSSGYSFAYTDFDRDQLRTQQVDGLTYGLTLGIDLFDGFNRRREKANARILISNQDYQMQQLEQQVKADMITIFYAYENNLLLLELEEQNLKTAQENLEIALERYKLGNLSGLELREVQQSLLEAEERLLLVQYQTKLAEISLLQISGRIMEYL